MATGKSKFSHIVITGASSGIGEALACAYALTGARLSLTGRDAVRLQQTAGKCRAAGAQVETGIIDATDAPAMEDFLMRADKAQPVELVIANAGVSAGTGSGRSEDPEQIRRLFDINLGGKLNTIGPLLPAMIARGKGHIALMSSLAAFRGWPGAPAYCASKAAVKIYGEGLRGALAHTGVGVSVVCPGFVVSRMTALNPYKMPFLMPTEKAAQIIKTGLEKGQGRIAFPWQAYALAWGLGILPDSLSHNLLKRMPGKPPQ